MKEKKIHIRIESELKKEFQTLLEKRGATITSAVELFIKKALSEQNLDFVIDQSNRR